MRVLIFVFISVILISCDADDERTTPGDNKNLNYDVNQIQDTQLVDTTEENLSEYLIDRNVLMIDLFSEDSILVNGELETKDELKESIRYFYEANSESEKDFEMPQYADITMFALDSKINTLTMVTQGKAADQKLNDELERMKLKRKICLLFPLESFREISEEATIKIQSHSGANENSYNKIVAFVKKEIEKLRSEKQSKIDWSISKVDSDEKKSILEILVPERILRLTLVANE